MWTPRPGAPDRSAACVSAAGAVARSWRQTGQICCGDTDTNVIAAPQRTRNPMTIAVVGSGTDCGRRLGDLDWDLPGRRIQIVNLQIRAVRSARSGVTATAAEGPTLAASTSRVTAANAQSDDQWQSSAVVPHFRSARRMLRDLAGDMTS
jgi:hypothetical protein